MLLEGLNLKVRDENGFGAFLLKKKSVQGYGNTAML